MRQLTPGDAFMYYTERAGSPNHIGSLGIFDPSTSPDGPVTFEKLTRYFEGRMHLGKSFRRRLVPVPFDLDDPWWVEDERFDLEYHLRHTALPSPGNWQQLCTLVSRLHAQPLDMSRPPWEVWMIEGLRDIPGVPPDSFGLLVRVHHTAIDGVGGVELLGALLQLDPAQEAPEDPRTWRPERVPGQLELLGKATLNNMVHRPLRLASGTVRAVPAMAAAVAKLRRGEVKLPRTVVPSTRFNTRVGNHRVFDSVTFDLDEIRRIKSAVPGATVNDAVLTICAGALRRYLGKLGELPEESLAAVVPMSIRTENDKGEEGNRVAQIFCDLHTDIADPLARLEAIAETTKVAKGSQQALGAAALIQMSSVLPGALLGMALRANAEVGSRSRSSGFTNCQVSNVPGPPFALYCGGAKLLSMHGLGPVVTGSALMHVVMSYCGTIAFSFTCDREIMPDPERYAEDIRRSFEELEAAIAAPTGSD